MYAYYIMEIYQVQVPFKSYFDVDAVKKYHRVIPMEDFFASEKLSNALWPESKRKSFCHSKRQGLPGEREHKGGACYAKSGNPFGSFWDTHNVDFVGSELYGNAGLHYDVSYPESVKGTFSFLTLLTHHLLVKCHPTTYSKYD